MSKPTHLLYKPVVRDGTQIPADATVDVYRGGATATQTVQVPQNALDFPIPVDDIGEIEGGDTIRVGTTASTLTVSEPSPDRETLIVSNVGHPAVNITLGTRLLPTNNRPALYKTMFSNSATTVCAPTTTGVVQTDPASGVAAATLARTSVDLLISGVGVTPRIEAGQTTGPLVLNAGHFDGIQTALDTLGPAGGTVIIPAGTWEVPSTLSIPPASNQSILVRGEGVSRTILHCSNPNQDILRIQDGFVRVEGLHLKGAVAAGSGRGIVVSPSAAGSAMARVSVTNCRVQDTGSWALDVNCGEPNAVRDVIECDFQDCSFVQAHRDGAVRLATGGPTHSLNLLSFARCEFGMAEASPGIYAQGSLLSATWVQSLSLVDCVFEPAANDQSWVTLSNCVTVRFGGCFFEDNLGQTVPPTRRAWFIEITSPDLDHQDSHGITVDTCTFRRNAADRCNAIAVTRVARCMLVSNCEIYSDSYPAPLTPGSEDPDGDIHVSAPGSELTVLGSWHATRSQGFRDVKVVDESRRAGAIFGNRIRLPLVTSQDITTQVLDPQDGDMAFDIDAERVKIWYANAWHELQSL
ncbi:MAG: hypothetical protein HZB25_02300 [Candidatus Eisenbacteria bacterium]|nr:hypothetical protein [Candidatus Eisenbacteria bacterium]